jgi:ARG and Rhodanese-Phosphatase-superfamily-associated Protein domain/Protein kinase domain
MLKHFEVTVGEVMRGRAVTVLPLFTKPAGPPVDYRLGSHALAKGALEVHDLHGVDRLEARNRSGDRLLLIEGDHLIGAKQNRVVTSSVLVGARAKLTLPASCVEQGRWEGDVRFEVASIIAPANIRRIIKISTTHSLLRRGARTADQSEIWSRIEEQQRRLRVSSSTRALSHTYASRAGEIGDISARFAYAPGATGLAIGVAGEIVSIDVFDKPETCAHYWPLLVQGAALESLGRPASERVGADDVKTLIDRLRDAAWAQVPPVGDGEELRAATAEAAASALLVDGSVVHLGIAPSWALSSKVVRRDLPERLAERYRVIARVGVGGAKEVFRATELATNREVAIARLPGVDPEDFADEIELARRAGDHVPAIYDAFIDDDQDGYMVMEYCGGPNLAQLGPLTVEQAGPILLAFARSIAAIHAAHVLHRDLKLENAVMCQTDRGLQIKLLDFGVSARAHSVSTAISDIRGGLRGTLPYMPNEVILGRELDARADVFAFGVCCHRLLTGELLVSPQRGENDFEYMVRVRHIARHDLSRLPALPDPVARIFPRIVDVEREHRPFMPEIVDAFARGFGHLPLAIPTTPAPAPRPNLPMLRKIAVRVDSPEHLLVAACPHAPLVVLEPGSETTIVRALGPDGRERWQRQLTGRLALGVRADLDNDGTREIYLAGRHHVVALDARGTVRFERTIEASTSPTLLALPDRERPRIAIDGRVLDPRSGADLGRIPYAYQGDGRRLVDATDGRGLAYNGFALQCFRGDHATGAAILYRPGEPEFRVAHLEQVHHRVQLVIYGPGGDRLHALPVAESDVATGDRLEISRLRVATMFGPRHAPLAVMRETNTAIVLVPLLGADPTLPSTIVAFSLPDARELWRTRVDTTAGRAVLADLDGDGKPELVVGTGSALLAYDPWSGAATMPTECTGMPVAFGDPFFSGYAHLITASLDGIELRRGPACERGAMRWTGMRGDLWRTGTIQATGEPLGPR